MSQATEMDTILVVDDVPGNIDILSGVLRPQFRVSAALNGERALQLADTHPRPDLILLDVMMPGMDGLEVCRRLKSKSTTADIPVIFVTALNDLLDEQKGLELGAVDYISKPISPPIVLARIKTNLALRRQNRELERKVLLRTEELNRTRFEIIRRLGRAAEFRDNETGLHVIRMSHYAHLIAEALGVGSTWTDLLFNAAPMHDVGKIGIPDHILLKPGKLTEEEWVIMRRHPQIGAEIIGDDSSDIMRMSREIALTHHEKWDGSGYPRRLKGEDIPLSARVIALADVFDSLTNARPYKKAWSVDEAIAFIHSQSGQHFDPALVAVFHEVLPEMLKIKILYAENPFESAPASQGVSG